jgi:hypothetical protein
MESTETTETNTDELEAEDGEALRGESIGIVRELILKANPDLVSDMVRGETLTELMDSVEPARAAYHRIIEAVRPVAPVVPAGGTGGAVVIEDLSADGLIKRGLATSRRQATVDSR